MGKAETSGKKLSVINAAGEALIDANVHDIMGEAMAKEYYSTKADKVFNEMVELLNDSILSLKDVDDKLIDELETFLK